VIPFNVTIPVSEQDRNLRTIFKHDTNIKKAILAWALEGAVEWYQRSNGGHDDGLLAPKDVISATEVYQLSMNPLYSFIQAECEVGCDEKGVPFEEGAVELWDAYDSPRAHYDIKAVKSSKALGKYLAALGFERYREKVGTRQYKWKYIRLLAAYEVPGQQPRSSECPLLKQSESLEWEIKKICGLCLTKPDPQEVPAYEGPEPMITQSDFEDYSRDVLEKLIASGSTVEPEILASETVTQYVRDRDMSETDRGTKLILLRRFAEFANSKGAELFLKVTQGKPLSLATE
jgi:phage/plasmid-associated DNA primase